MPKKVEDAKLALENSALEIEKTEMSAEIRINDPKQMQMFQDCSLSNHPFIFLCWLAGTSTFFEVL
jgi:hypothetical protein